MPTSFDTPSRDGISSRNAPSSVSSSDTHAHTLPCGQPPQPGESRGLLTSAVQLMGSKHGQQMPAHLQEKWSKIRERLSRIQSAGAKNKRKHARTSSKEPPISPRRARSGTHPVPNSRHNSACDLRSLAHAHASQSDRLCEAYAADACTAVVPLPLSDTAARTMSADLHALPCSAVSSRCMSLQQERMLAHAPVSGSAAHRGHAPSLAGSVASCSENYSCCEEAGAATQMQPASHHFCGHATMPAATSKQQQEGGAGVQAGLKATRSVPSLQHVANAAAHEPQHHSRSQHPSALPSRVPSTCGSFTSPASCLTSHSQILGSYSILQLQPQQLQGSGSPSTSSGQQLLLTGSSSQQPLVPSAALRHRRSSASMVQVDPRSPSAAMRASSNSNASPGWLEPTPSVVTASPAPTQARSRGSAEHARSPTAAAVLAAESSMYQQQAAQRVCAASRGELQPSTDAQPAPHPPAAGKPSRLARLRTVNTYTPVHGSEDEAGGVGGGQEDSEGEGRSTGSHASSVTLQALHHAPRRNFSTLSAQHHRPPLPPTPPRSALKQTQHVGAPELYGVQGRSSSCQNLVIPSGSSPSHAQQQQQQQQQQQLQEDQTKESEAAATLSHDSTLSSQLATSPTPGTNTLAWAMPSTSTPPCPHLQGLATTSSIVFDARKHATSELATTLSHTATPHPPLTPNPTPPSATSHHPPTTCGATSVPNPLQQHPLTHSAQSTSTAQQSHPDHPALPPRNSEHRVAARQHSSQSAQPRENARLLAHMQTYSPHLIKPQASGGSTSSASQFRRHSISLLLSSSSRTVEREKSLSASSRSAAHPTEARTPSSVSSSTNRHGGWLDSAQKASELDTHEHTPAVPSTTSPLLPCTPCAGPAAAPSPCTHTQLAPKHGAAGATDGVGRSFAASAASRASAPHATAAAIGEEAAHTHIDSCAISGSNALSSGMPSLNSGRDAACGWEGPTTLFAHSHSGSSSSSSRDAGCSPPSSSLIIQGALSGSAHSGGSTNESVCSSGGAGRGAAPALVGFGGRTSFGGASRPACTAQVVGVGEDQQQLLQRQSKPEQQCEKQDGQQQECKQQQQEGGGLRARLMRSLNLAAW